MRAAILFPAIFLFMLPLHAVDVSVSNVGSSTCGGPDGTISFEIVGGIPPFTITLFDGGGGMAQEFSSSMTFHFLESLLPGLYSVSVIDAALESASTGPLEVTVAAGGTFYLQSIATCPGEPPIALVNMIQNGIVDIWGPDVIDMSQQLDECGEFTYRALMFADFGSYPLQYEDINGCILDAWVDLYGPETLPVMQVMGVTGSCTNGASGSITVAYGGMGPFPRMLSRLKNSAGEVVAGGCSQSAIALTTVVQHTFTGLAPGTYWVHASGQTFNFDFTDWYDYQCRDSIEVVVSALAGDCGVVNGRVFVDNNANCVANPGESNVPATVVRLEPGPYFGNTNSSGQYSVQVPYGTYDVFAEHPVLDQGCPVVQVVQQAVHNNVNLPMEVGAPLDMQVSMSDGVARPGFEYQVAVHVSNMTAALAGTVTLVVEQDAVLSLLSATPAPTSTAGNTLTWSGGAFSFNNAFQTRTVQLRFQVPPDVGLLGTELLTTATVTTTNADADLSNNTYLLERTITGAYDPNDKLAYTSSGNTEVWQINEDEWIDYTIRFQNTGTDTAFTVVIADTLPPNLDPGSIIVGAASHTFTWELRDQGTLKFYFPNIQLPDSNINEPRSHGFVGFRIRPRLPLLPGDEITNIANIYFDFNPPVITEPSVLTVPVPGVLVSPRVLLDGPYVEATQRMNDGLRTAGLVPLAEPYTALGYAHMGGGGETTSPGVLAITGDNAVVDWVVVELRSANAPYGVVATRSALLKRNGDVTSTNGMDPVAFNVAAGDYRVAVQHRNHLACMTNAAIALGPTTTLVDLSVASTATYGTEARKQVGTRMVLWPGDVRFNGDVKYTGTNNDRDAVLLRIGGSTPTNVVSGYYMEDVNLDGDVKYTGTGNDRDVILQTIGGVVPTAVRTQQMP